MIRRLTERDGVSILTPGIAWKVDMSEKTGGEVNEDSVEYFDVENVITVARNSPTIPTTVLTKLVAATPKITALLVANFSGMIAARTIKYLGGLDYIEFVRRFYYCIWCESLDVVSDSGHSHS